MTTTGFWDHTVIGTPNHVANLIANHTTAGTLLAVSRLVPLPNNDGRVAVKLRLRDTTPAPPQRPALPAAFRARAVTRPTPAPAEHGAASPEVDYKLTIRVRSSRSRHRRRILTIAAVAAVTVSTIVALAGYLLAQLVALIATHAAALLGVLGAVLLALAVLRGGGGRKRHCPGCD
jgi:hypothetical protein